jgi:type IV secretory pathway VirB3-like protein
MELTDFSLPVHKSLQQPDLLMGIPKEVFVLILLLTIILINFFGLAMILVAVVLYVPCSIISKDDPNLLTIALGSLFQIDFLEG